MNKAIISFATLANGILQAGTPSPGIIPPTVEAPSEWEFRTAIYAPLMGIDGTVGVGGLSGSVDVPFSDILENLDAGLSGSFEARRGPWSFTADAIWLKLSASDNPFANAVFSFEQQQIMASASIGYAIFDNDCTTLDFLAGAALTHLDVDVALSTPLLPTTFRSASGTETWVDPFIGLRFRHTLSKRWSVFATGLYGGFGIESDESWQALGGLAFRMTEHTALALAYRVIATDYQDGGFTYDVEVSGPNLGLVVHF